MKSPRHNWASFVVARFAPTPASFGADSTFVSSAFSLISTNIITRLYGRSGSNT